MLLCSGRPIKRGRVFVPFLSAQGQGVTSKVPKGSLRYSMPVGTGQSAPFPATASADWNGAARAPGPAPKQALDCRLIQPRLLARELRVRQATVVCPYGSSREHCLRYWCPRWLLYSAFIGVCGTPGDGTGLRASASKPTISVSSPTAKRCD